MSATRSVYKVFRSILFTTILVVIGFVACLYVAMSLTPVQDAVRKKAEHELSAFLGGKVDIGSVEIKPFNEVRLHEVSFYTPEGSRCISVGRIGAGISLWPLVSSGTIELVYAELISLDAEIIQDKEGGALNIDYIIKALQPKDRNKPKTEFRVMLRNVVIRKSRISFDRSYIPKKKDKNEFDVNHILLKNFRADIELPLITNDNFIIDLRRLAFDEDSGISVNSLSVYADISPKEISFSNLKLSLDQSEISISDQKLDIDGYGDILNSLKRGNRSIAINCSHLVPAEFSPFYKSLSSFTDPCDLMLDISGNLSNLSVNTFKVDSYQDNIRLALKGRFENILRPGNMSGEVENLELAASSSFIDRVLNCLNISDENIVRTARNAGDISLEAGGRFDLESRTAEAVANLEAGIGKIALQGDCDWNGAQSFVSRFTAKAENTDIGSLIQDKKLGLVSIEAEGSVNVRGKRIDGEVVAAIPYVDWNSNRFENIHLEANKSSDEVNAHVDIADKAITLKADVSCLLSGSSSLWNLDADIAHIYPHTLGVKGFKPNESLSTVVSAGLSGNSLSNAGGSVKISDFDLKGARALHLDNLTVSGDVDGENRYYAIDSDYINGFLRGVFSIENMSVMIRNLISQVVPVFVTPARQADSSGEFAEFGFTLNAADDFYKSLHAPVRPGVPVTISGDVNGDSESVSIRLDAPYLVQGKDKLIKNTVLRASLTKDNPADVRITSDFPVKKDRALLSIGIGAKDSNADATIEWNMASNSANKGTLGLFANFMRDVTDRSVSIFAGFKESGFSLNGALWQISPARINYSGKTLDISDLRISHDNQFVDIHGTASSDPDDRISVELADIDLEYIFNILNINHVDFGGIATGKAHVSSLFTKTPVAVTDGLFVKDLAYNDCVLGDGKLESHWDNEQKMVAINADISGKDDSSATVRGGVYVTRDSLSFDFGAKKLDIEFLEPFMSGFTSSVKGRASGNVKLYGTFSDIDLGGAAFADEITMLVDYTNVYYTGSDSIFFSPGKISVPHIRLHDRYGNSCMLRGEVTHDYLKNARFNFNVSDLDRLLVYDTNAKMNPRWYGHVFANGSALIKGSPGLVSVGLNMSTSPNSEFTLVLDETQVAEDYTFLTFSDRRKEAVEKIEVEETFEDRFKKEVVPEVKGRPDLFVLDMALDVTPGAKMIIVMDPQAGDKITANGNGALQIRYDSNSDNFFMYGKYVLNNGYYNFSLQDLILKNFKIQSGSSISFNGDPLQGILDITAAYRVNTNLKDLDRSFESDPDLNRTSVPVDALLKVSGDIHAPEINFDITLPTVTSDVERKVRSIISTEDMMNKQVIYLLALNRFYTPEYMGAEQGGELASVASSTISSQLQNIIGSLTDKFSVAPSFKSEKSDLSDMEVDVALSSSLFDNRLLINGNLGYRDRSTSQTTFIGDFDIEYLLSRDGRLRLKAYNHFNDASYYLKSALTTQGIGIVYRKDFDDPFTFLKRLFRKKKNKSVPSGDNTKQREPALNTKQPSINKKK